MWQKSLAFAVALVALALGPSTAAVSATRSSPEPGSRPLRLGVEGEHFTVDGTRRFLLGLSLFDALGSVPPSDDDLAAVRSWGIDCVRVWAHWHEAIYRADGSLSPEGRARLKKLVEQLQAHSLLLELVLLRPGQMPGEQFALFQSEAARLRAVSEISRALKGTSGVFFDIYNEHDHGAGAISHPEARRVRDAVKSEDPERLVTLSSTGSHFWEPDGSLGTTGLTYLREESGTGRGESAVDVVGVHLPRTPDWAKATEGRVQALLKALRRQGTRRPLYLNEENRARDGRILPAGDYLTALAGARTAGAAGWLFHTGAGFDLRKTGLQAALNPQERKALASLRSVLRR